MESLNALAEQASAELWDNSFVQYRTEIEYIIEKALECAQAGLAREPEAMAPAQIEYRTCNKIEDILDNVTVPDCTCPVVPKYSILSKRGFMKTAVSTTRIKKPSKPPRRTIADYECAATLLLFARQFFIRAMKVNRKDFWSVVG
jgi:hypothetical protein